MTNPDSLIQVNQLSGGYGGPPVFSNIAFRLGPGRLLGILGPNGAGKSTLLKTCAGLHPASGGTIHLGGRSLSEWHHRERARFLAYVPQTPVSGFAFSVRELVGTGRLPHQGLLRTDPARDRAVIDHILRETGLTHLAEESVDHLSGGEFQRAVLARALAQEPSLLLLDEPTAHLDLPAREHFFRLLRQRCREAGLGVACVLHDLNAAAEWCDQLLLLGPEGQVACGPTEEVLQPASLARAYGHAFEVLAHPRSGRPLVSLAEAPS